MASPFPGLDPFIESCGLWEDFHSHLIEAIAGKLTAQVPDRYVVRTGQRAYVVVAESQGKAEHLFKPDVGITSAQGKQAGGMAVAQPDADSEAMTMRAFVSTEFRESFIEIHALQPARRLVTCLEILSPSNKRPGTSGWELYARKRQGLLMGEANLVEIDLLRGGARLPMLDSWPDCPFTILVSRQNTAPLCRVWPAYFHRPLPSFPVPLAEPDPALPLDLQPLVETIYDRYRYGHDIDYSSPLVPPPSATEAEWLAGILPRQ